MGSFISGLAATSLFLIGLLFVSACGGPLAAPSRFVADATTAPSVLAATLGEALVAASDIRVRCASERRGIASASALVTLAAAAATSATLALPPSAPAGSWCAVTVEAKPEALAEVASRALPLTGAGGLLLASEAIQVGSATPKRLGLTRLFLPLLPTSQPLPAASATPASDTLAVGNFGASQRSR
jgi:hypothetical protein